MNKTALKKLLGMIVLLALAILFGSGCRTFYDLARADAEPATAFLPEKAKLQDMDPMFPYRKMYVNKNADWKKYGSIIVKSAMNKDAFSKSKWQSFNESGVFSSRSEELKYYTRYLENSFRNAIQYDPLKRFKVVGEPGPGTAVLELSLTQIVPTKATLTAAETIAGFFVPGVGLLTIFNSGEVAFEGKMTDSQTGEVIAMFADREKDRAAIVNIASFTWYKNSENMMDDWSRKFVMIVNAGSYLEVEARCPFTLIDW